MTVHQLLLQRHFVLFPERQRSCWVCRSVKRSTCGRSAASSQSCFSAGRCIQARRSTTRSDTSRRRRVYRRNTCSTRPPRRRDSSTDKTLRAIIHSGDSRYVFLHEYSTPFLETIRPIHAAEACLPLASFFDANSSDSE